MKRVYLAVVLVMFMSLMGRVTAQEARISAGANVNLRAEPNTLSDVLLVLPPLTSLSIIGRTESNLWVQVNVETPNAVLTGWVSAQYVQVGQAGVASVEEVEVATGQTIPPVDFLPHVHNVTPAIMSIVRRGIEQGNRFNVFSKVGDSITYSNMFLQPIGDNRYNLGEYWHLEAVIQHYLPEKANTANSFKNVSLSAMPGWTVSAVMGAQYANGSVCLAGETPLACEYRVVRPSVAVIMLGTNDVGFLPEDLFRHNLEAILQVSQSAGVVPILTTIPPRTDYDYIPERVLLFNQIITQTAIKYGVPYLDYYALMVNLPNGGLDVDGVHPNIPPAGYRGVTNFTANNLNYGYTMRNLLTLHGLDVVWRLIQQGG